MPVDERTFVADVKSWIDAILVGRHDLPFGEAKVEEHMVGGRKRLDLQLRRRSGSGLILTGEVKMPDSPEGRAGVFHQDLVEDAFEKASRNGARYYFTWNVRELALFETHQEGVPFHERIVEVMDVVDVSVSDDVAKPDVEQAIKEFLQRFLERLRELDGGAPIRQLPLDQRFIRRIEAALDAPVTLAGVDIARAYAADSGFKAQLDAWMVDEQGWEVAQSQSQENLERAARLSCYGLLNRVVFYEVLRRRFVNLAPLAALKHESVHEFRSELALAFQRAVRASGDYETVFAPAGTGDSLPLLSDPAAAAWAKVVRDVEAFDFARLDYDVVGRMYERLIGPVERRRYGQFYTSPEVVDLINAFCIRHSTDHVMDPSCGGGTFLVRAYARKQALADREGQHLGHQELLSQIFGVDTAAFPAQLSTINLAVRQLSDEPNYPRVLRSDFFDVRGSRTFMRLPGANASEHAEVTLPTLDAVVGNPPYIRQEHLSPLEKSKLRLTLEADWGAGRPDFSGRSDIYVHFFSHAGALVRPGGYVGLVTSVGWLDTDYGFRLQEFLLSHFRIVAVIESQVDKWFEDARVTTAVTVLQREEDPIVRRSNLVKFVELRAPLSEIWGHVLQGQPSVEAETERQGGMDAIRDLIEKAKEDEVADYWRMRVVSQGELWDAGCRVQMGAGGVPAPNLGYRAGKWGQYLRAPDIWFDLLRRGTARWVPVGEVAEVRFGFKTGVDKFFCVRDVTEAELAAGSPSAFKRKWSISPEDTEQVRIIQSGDGSPHLVESRFLEPELHSLMEAQGIVVKRQDVAKHVINAPVVRAQLRGTHLERYIAYAERQGWHSGSTVKQRAQSGPWYDLGLRSAADRADLLWPMAQQYRHLAPWNQDRLPVNHNLFELRPSERTLPRLLWAVLNSTVVALSKHQYGRAAGIEGNLKTEVVDVNMMLIPDPRVASPVLSKRLLAAAEAMATRLSARTLPDEFEMDDRRELDDGVLELLGVADPSERAALRELVYNALRTQYGATRQRERVAQRDRSRSARGGAGVGDLADDLWQELEPSLALQEFPRDFLGRVSRPERIDLPAGPVQVGTALMSTGRDLAAGEVRVGGQGGQVLAVGSVARARFLEALADAGKYGSVELPDEATCTEALRSFETYKRDVERRVNEAAAGRTRDERRRRAIVSGVMRRVVGWSHSQDARSETGRHRARA